MKCQYEGCRRYSREGDPEGYCIFHSRQVEEKTEAFQKAWKMFLDKRTRDDGSYKHIDCSGFVFPGSLSLSKFTFSEGANFQGARFSGHAHFEGVRFLGHAYFGAARFLGSAYFEEARFEKISSFDGTQFLGIAFFEEVRFEETAEFQRTHFREGGHFWGTTFNGDAHFWDTNFTEGIQFVGARFRKKIDFRNAKGGPIFFEKAVLDGADLRQCSLSNVHLTHITKHRGAMFGPTDVHNVNWTGSYLLREKVLDQNYLYDFRTKNRFNRYFLYPLWRVTSNCGRSLALWAGWSMLIALAFGAIYSSKGTMWFHEAARWDAITPYYYSIVTFTTLGFGDITPYIDNRVAQLTITFEVVLGYIMLGGLIAILANKMARRAL